jgi:hypothetical protein
MDWTTAWEGLVPTYGLAVVLHAIFPLWSVPVWPILGYYAYKVLGGARAAVDPWRSRGSPRPYLLTCFVTLIVHLVASASLSAAVTAAVTGAVAVSTAALFVARSAPPNVRRVRPALVLAVVSMALSSLVAPGFAFGILAIEGGAALVAFAWQLILAIASVVMFSVAGRVAKHRAPVVARKTPRA